MDKKTRKAAFITLAIFCGLMAITAIITAAQATERKPLPVGNPISLETILNSMCIVVRKNGNQYCPMSKHGICQDASIVCGKKKKG